MQAEDKPKLKQSFVRPPVAHLVAKLGRSACPYSPCHNLLQRNLGPCAGQPCRELYCRGSTEPASG